MYIIELNFGSIKFEDDFAIVTMNTGIDVGNGIVNRLIDLINGHFAGSSYCYIDNHINDHSVDPLETRRLTVETPLKAVAVVASTFSLQNLFIEELFYTTPVLVTSNINDAKQKLKPFLTEDKVKNKFFKSVRDKSDYSVSAGSWQKVYSSLVKKFF